MDTQDILFYVRENDEELSDVEGSDMWVVFATHYELDNDTVNGSVLHVHKSDSKLERMMMFCGDDGAMCEDYLMHPTGTVTADEIRAKAISLGMVENSKLRDCGWG